MDQQFNIISNMDQQFKKLSNIDKQFNIISIIDKQFKTRLKISFILQNRKSYRHRIHHHYFTQQHRLPFSSMKTLLDQYHYSSYALWSNGEQKGRNFHQTSCQKSCIVLPDPMTCTHNQIRGGTDGPQDVLLCEIHYYTSMQLKIFEHLNIVWLFIVRLT